MNKYSLYSGHKGVEEATKEMDNLIEKFANELENWAEKHQKIGGNDTASREMVSITVAKRLGLG